MRLQYHFILAVAAICALSPASAQSLFDGKWKMDIGSAKLPERPNVVLLKGGVYRCTSCIPAYGVRADGAFHTVSGHPDFDAVAVSVVDPRSIKMQFRKLDKLVGAETDVVSADGKMLTYTYVDSSAVSGKTTQEIGVQMRLGPVSANAHKVSGSWRTTKITSSTGNLVALHSDGTHLDASFPSGIHYSPTFGGGFVPVEGAPPGTTVSVVREGARAFTASYKQDGKIRQTSTFTVGATGRSAILVTRDLTAGTTTSVTVLRQ